MLKRRESVNTALLRRTKPSGVHHAVIRIYDAVGNMIETHEQAGDFKEP
jgi:hypothetical protein